ncbi:MAG: hypothetical protein IJ781_03560 [Atopobiaceae bacterium]|nr:hypothetical protein [Atopobiaceae bacterium]
MAGFSIVMLTLLFAWPLLLVVAVFYLTFETAALVVTSPAFPFIIAAMVAGTLGTANVAIVLWRRYKNPEGAKLSLRSFTWTYVWYAISFVACCIAVYFAGVAIIGFFSQTA